jgi:hypothetical protein
MSGELNVYPVGYKVEFEIHSNKERDDTSCYNYSDFVFKKSTSKNMYILWKYFYKHDNYPEYYMGIAKSMAICKCPISGKEEWYNGERCLNIENPKKDSIVTVEIRIKDTIYSREFIFMGWVKTPVHEWKMRKGTVLMIEKRFVDGLLPQDKKYLKITR